MEDNKDFEDLKEDYGGVGVGSASKISTDEREKLLLKTAKNLPDNPADSGMKASAVKPMFYKFATDLEDSLYAYINRAIEEFNINVDSLVQQINYKFKSDKEQMDKMLDLVQKFKNDYIAYCNDMAKTIEEVFTDINNEVRARESAISNLKGNVSADFNTLAKLENKLINEEKNRIAVDNQEIADRKQAITDLVNGASAEYNTLKKIETRVKEEITNRQNAINTAINSLVDSAPSALNTLKKLAQSINNDASFYTTINTLINTKHTEAKAYTDTKINQEVVNRNTAIEKAISDLVDSSPEALNTLKELSDALGNDSNFAATITTLINTKYNASVSHTNTLVNKEISDRQTAITTAINNLIASAPSNLNTLKELASAIGDDAAFSTTIKNLINTKYDASIKHTNDSISQEIEDRNEAITTAVDIEASTRQTQIDDINTQINNIKSTLSVSDTNYDTIQKICDNIKGIISTLDAHTSNTNNPHDTTATNVSATYNSQATNVQTALNNLKTLCDSLSGTTEGSESAIAQLVQRITNAEQSISNSNESIYTNKNDIDNIKSALQVDDSTLDTLQEIVDTLKDGTNGLEALYKAINTKQDKSTAITNQNYISTYNLQTVKKISPEGNGNVANKYWKIGTWTYSTSYQPKSFRMEVINFESVGCPEIYDVRTRSRAKVNDISVNIAKLRYRRPDYELGYTIDEAGTTYTFYLKCLFTYQRPNIYIYGSHSLQDLIVDGQSTLDTIDGDFITSGSNYVYAALNDQYGNLIDATYLKRSGGQMTGFLTYKDSGGTVRSSIWGNNFPNDTDVDLIDGRALVFRTSYSDYGKIYGTKTDTTDDGSLVIETGDNGNEPIYVQQKSGTTITNKITLLNKYGNTELKSIAVGGGQQKVDNKFGLSMTNSDIIEINGLWHSDTADTPFESHLWKRSNGNWDALRILDGNAYLHQNITTRDSTFPSETIYHTGNLTSDVVETLIADKLSYYPISKTDSVGNSEYTNIDTSYLGTAKNFNGGTEWVHLIKTQHKNGTPNQDSEKYSLELSSTVLNDGNLFFRKKINGVWGVNRSIYDNNNLTTAVIDNLIVGGALDNRVSNIENILTTDDTSLDTLQEIIDTLKNDTTGLSALYDTIGTKANKTDVYTKSEADTKLNLKANLNDVYTKAETDTKINVKANSSDVYTKSQVDTKVDTKANSSDVYTKTEIDKELEVLPISLIGGEYADITTSYVGTTGLGPSGYDWDAIIRAQHRNGVEDGQSYSMELFSTIMNNTTSLYWRKMSNNVWGPTREIYDTGNLAFGNGLQRDGAVVKVNPSFTGLYHYGNYYSGNIILDFNSTIAYMLYVEYIDSDSTANITVGSSTTTLAYGIDNTVCCSNGTIYLNRSGIRTLHRGYDTVTLSLSGVVKVVVFKIVV